MKRCSIIIHSVTGNNYIIASHLKSLLEQKGVEMRLYRVEDADLHIFANESEAANEYYEEMLALPVIKNEKLLKSDAIVLGCPTYFANISAEMKTFIDGTVEYFEAQALQGKYFGCFTSCSEGLEDARGTLWALRKWAEQMNMPEVPNGDLIHVSGPANIIRPSIDFGKVLEDFAENIAKALL